MKSLGSFRRTFAPWNDAQAKPFISIENVTKKFGDFAAVNDLSLNIYNREFFALLGASGCGKSTLLRMLAGFEEPTAGRILIDGQDMRGIPPYKRPVNMMFQSYALFPHMTVEANIAFGLKQEGMAKGDIEARVAEISSPAASASAWRWHVVWRSVRRFCCSTSRSVHLTRNCARKRSLNSWTCR